MSTLILCFITQIFHLFLLYFALYHNSRLRNTRVLLQRLFKLVFLVPGVQAGDDEDAYQGHGHAADGGNCHGLGYLGAGFPKDGGQADEGGGGGHDAGTYSSRACHEDAVTDVLDAFHFPFAEQVINIGGYKNGIVVNDAEDGDEAYPDGDAEVVAKQVLEPDATRNGRRGTGKKRRSSYFISGI